MRDLHIGVAPALYMTANKVAASWRRKKQQRSKGVGGRDRLKKHATALHFFAAVAGPCECVAGIFGAIFRLVAFWDLSHYFSAEYRN
jgi:hypothetical protein